MTSGALHAAGGPAPGPRTAFLVLLQRELDLAAAAGTQLTVLLLDADDFASVAASVGPRRADALLAELARRLTANSQPEAAIVRTGGDGLAAVLPGEDRAGAETVFARFKADLLREPPADGPVAVSGGIATATVGEAPVSLLVRAHQALGRAKEAGKNTANVAP